MLGVIETKRFLKGVKQQKKRGKDLIKLKEVVSLLKHKKELPKKFKTHPLKGNWAGTFDCHIEPGWILIYEIDKKENLLRLIATGSHADLFDM